MGKAIDRPVKDRAGLFNALTLILGVLVAVATVLTRSTHGTVLTWVNAIWVVLALLTAIVVYLKSLNDDNVKDSLKAAERVRQQQLEDVEFRTKAEVNGAFLGASDRLRELAAASGDKNVAVFLQDVVMAAGTLLSNEHPRVAYFAISDVCASPREMKRVASWGIRMDEFTSEFVESSGKDANVWELLASDEPDYQADLTKEIPSGFDADRRPAYRSYVSVAVRAGGIELGMLTANTLEVDGFSDVHIAMMRVLARLIATGVCTSMSSQKLNAARRRGASRA